MMILKCLFLIIKLFYYRELQFLSLSLSLSLSFSLFLSFSLSLDQFKLASFKVV